MKRILLGAAFLVAFSANAQVQKQKKFLNNPNLNHQFLTELPVAGNTIPKATAHVLRNSPATVAWTSIPLGHSANSYSNAFSPKEPLWYDPQINTLTFVHRGGGSGIATGNDYVADVSKDGGATWSADQGPVYSETGLAPGRYPQGVIYNPAGNTNPDNAFVYATGAGLAGTNDAWGGHAEGAWKLDNSAPAVSSMLTPFHYYGASGTSQSFVNRTGGEFWEAAQDLDIPANTLTGTITVFHGTWNNSTNTYTLDTVKYAYPSSDMYGGDCDVAFGPDGVTGYIVTMDGYLTADPAVATAYIWKTTDGGATWTALGFLDLNNIGADFGGASPITSHIECDIAVDGAGNLHIATTAGLTDANSVWSQVQGSWGVYDLYTTDGGTTWKAQQLGLPAQYGGDYGTDNAGGWRQSPGIQIATDWNGDKVFIVWTETDPTLDPDNNYYPDIHVNAWDRTTGNWTGALNLTSGSGEFFYHNLAQFVSASSGQYQLHIAYQTIADATISVNPIEYAYLSGLTVDDTQFSTPGNPTTIVLVTGINEHSLTSANVSNVYPNPVSDVSFIDITLEKAQPVTMTITSLVGQTVKEINLGQLNAGVNKIAINKDNLAAGAYFAQIKSGNAVVTRNFMVK